MKHLFLVFFVFSLNGRFIRIKNFERYSELFRALRPASGGGALAYGGMRPGLWLEWWSGWEREMLPGHQECRLHVSLPILWLVRDKIICFTGAVESTCMRQECRGSLPWSAATSTRDTWLNPRTMKSRLRLLSTSQQVGGFLYWTKCHVLTNFILLVKYFT